MRLFYSSAILLLMLSAASQTPAADDFMEPEQELPLKYERVKVEIDSDFNNRPYYIESGIDELGLMILEKAPESSGGMKSLAKLVLDVDWQINSEQKADMCALHGVRIINRSVFITPQWNPSGEIREEDDEKWNRFLEAVSSFQNINREIITQHLNGFAQEIRRIRPVRRCNELKKLIDDAGMRHLRNAGQEINAVAFETGSGRDFRDLDYPDFFSDRPEARPDADKQPEKPTGQKTDGKQKSDAKQPASGGKKVQSRKTGK